MTYDIQLAGIEDAAAINEIYNYYVDESTCTFQTVHETLQARVEWLANRTERHPVTVCRLGGKVIAWGALSPWKGRSGYDYTVEVSFYVHHEHLRRGIGKRLLRDLIDRAEATGCHVLIGGVCTEHAGSIRLQESFGFEKVAHFRETGFKFGRWLDVAYFQLTLETNSPASG